MLEPLLVKSTGEKRGTVVIATVKGDIHDIGKNLVALAAPKALLCAIRGITVLSEGNIAV